MRVATITTALCVALTLPVGAEAQIPPTSGSSDQPAQSNPPAKPNPPTTSPPMSSLPPPPMKYTPPKDILGEGLDAWVKKLDPRTTKDPVVRELAVRTVPMFGEEAKKYLPKIIDRLRDIDFAVRQAALLVVTSNPVDDKEQQKEILLAMGDLFMSHGQASIRIQAANACMRIGPPAKRFIPNLIGEGYLTNQTSYELRKAAAEALGQVGRDDSGAEINKPDKRAIVALIGALSDPALLVRIEAAQSLMFLGPPEDDVSIAQEKKVLVDRIAKEPDKVLAIWLRVCLMRLDRKLITDAMLAPIATALRSTEHRYRINAADAMAVMGPDASRKSGVVRDVALELEKSDKPEDLEMIAKCLWALGSMGKEADFAMNDVKRFENHSNETIKALAKDAVGKMQGKKAEK